MYLTESISFFDSAFTVGCMGGCRKTLFRDIKKAYKYLDKAKKAGIPPEDTIDVEMQALSLVGTTAQGLRIQLDRSGKSIDDKEMLKASKAMYKFGEALRKVGDKGLKGKPISAIGKLKKVFKVLDAALMGDYPGK
jgi:hypothetical protein